MHNGYVELQGISNGIKSSTFNLQQESNLGEGLNDIIEVVAETAKSIQELSLNGENARIQCQGLFVYKRINGRLVKMRKEEYEQKDSATQPLPTHAVQVPGGVLYCSYDSQGKKHGPAKAVLGSDTIFMNYLHGKVDGEVFEHLGGIGELQYSLVNNIRHGKAYLSRLDGGTLEYEYQNGVKHGGAIEEFDGEQIRFTFINGIRTGRVVITDRNGVESKGFYDNGILQRDPDVANAKEIDLNSDFDEVFKF